MTIKGALHKATQQLNKQKIKSASLDAEVLLAHALNKSREYLLSHPEHTLSNSQRKKFAQYIKRRAKHEPVAYITGHKEFFGFDFLVNKNVLIPRPETETLVEEAIRIVSQMSTVNCQLLDIGTGSGCIAISLAKHLPKAKITAIDSSKQALNVARKNARLNKVSSRIKFIHGDPLENHNPQPTTHNLILANLPYIPNNEYKQLAPDIKNYEPKQALIAGPDGLKYYRQLFKQLQGPIFLYSYIPMFLILELAPTQIKSIKKLAKKYFPLAQINFKKDLADKHRVAVIKI